MDKRRTAADALQMSPDVASFISGGVPSPSDSEGSQRLDKSSIAESKRRPTSKESATVTEQTAKPKRKGTFGQRTSDKRSSKENPSPTYTHAMAQARIQKSVRFLPQLIARFEDHCLKELQAGRKPPTLQDALNDALRDWLN